MINFKRNTLCLLAAIAVSWSTVSAAASLEIEFTNGAQMNAPITGGANFNGTGNCNFNGSATEDVTLTAGNVKVASDAPFNGGSSKAIFEGGSLEATAPMNLPELVMNAPGTVTADHDVNLANPVSGLQKLTAAGAGQFTPTTDLSSGGVNNAAVDFTGTGGLNIVSLTNKLPTGYVSVYAGSQVKVAPGLTIGEDDIVAADKWKLKSGSGMRLGNGAVLDRSLVIEAYS